MRGTVVRANGDDDDGDDSETADFLPWLGWRGWWNLPNGDQERIRQLSHVTVQIKVWGLHRRPGNMTTTWKFGSVSVWFVMEG